MDELRIEAEASIHVADLNITVGPGITWVSRSDLEGSICLQTLIKLGKVRVSSGARSRVSKDPPPKRAVVPSVLRSRPQKGVGRQVRVEQQPDSPKGLSPEEAQQMADRAAQQAAQQAVAAMAAQFQQLLESTTPSTAPSSSAGIEQVVEQAVVQALKSAQVPVAASSSSGDTPLSGPVEPMFIPTGIVTDEAESLSVKSESSSDSGNLDNAASALKALRKGKKSKS